MSEQFPDPDPRVFIARALPRSRAWLSLIFLGGGLLSVGGAIEYGTGSPMTAGQGVTSYFAALFGFHAVVSCGAALIGAFPAIALRGVKIGWLVACAILYAIAFSTWRSHPGSESFGQWLSLWPHYLPALLPIVAGCLWSNRAVHVEEQGASVGARSVS